MILEPHLEVALDGTLKMRVLTLRNQRSFYRLLAKLTKIMAFALLLLVMAGAISVRGHGLGALFILASIPGATLGLVFLLCRRIIRRVDRTLATIGIS